MKKLLLFIIGISFLSCSKEEVIPMAKPLKTASSPVFNTGTGFNSGVYASVMQSDGKTVIGGSFTSYNGTTANRIIRLNTDGSVDASFVIGTGFNNSVLCMAIQTDGKIIIGGQFTSYNGITANRVARLNTNGSIDASFISGSGFNQSIQSLAIQSNGNIVLTGGFTYYNGTFAQYIIRLSSSGLVDSSFLLYTTTFNTNGVSAVAIQSDGKIIVGGFFASYNGYAASRIIRLNVDGSKDLTFIYGSGFNTTTRAISIQLDGKILIGGDFTSYNGVSANKIIRLNANGLIDASFNVGSGFNSTVSIISILSTGEAVIGGSFTSYNGTTANRLVKLSSIGGANTISADFNGPVLTVGIRSDDSIMYAGGLFTTYNGTTKNYITAVN